MTILEEEKKMQRADQRPATGGSLISVYKAALLNRNLGDIMLLYP
jgi:hypothetical protein